MMGATGHHPLTGTHPILGLGNNVTGDIFFVKWATSPPLLTLIFRYPIFFRPRPRSCGSSATYEEKITTVDGRSLRTITSSGCPNHYSICTGKPGEEGCGEKGEEGSASEATDQGKTRLIPAVPVISSSKLDLEFVMGEIAVALNGVSIYGGAVDDEGALLNVDDKTSE